MHPTHTGGREDRKKRDARAHIIHIHTRGWEGGREGEREAERRVCVRAHGTRASVATSVRAEYWRCVTMRNVAGEP
jgi:hypothetical protein